MRPSISIIIPVHDRERELARTLRGLESQAPGAPPFEVVVVDDGGSEAVELAARTTDLNLRYLRQSNAGGVAARNNGAHAARGDVLIFLDDDMSVGRNYVAAIFAALRDDQKRIARGRTIPWCPPQSSVFARTTHVFDADPMADMSRSPWRASPVACFTSNNFALSAAGFAEVGGWREVVQGMHGLNGGLWADLELAHRADALGWKLVTVYEAEVAHRDHVLESLETARHRAERMAMLAAALLLEHEEIRVHLPMLDDKEPLRWRTDSPALSARKLARIASASPPVLSTLVAVAHALEHVAPRPGLLTPIYRWILGAHHLRGYRLGARKLERSA